MTSMKVDLHKTIPLMAYLLLATGTILPLYAFGVLFPLHTAIILFYFFAFATRPGFAHSLIFTCVSLFPMLVVYLIASTRSADAMLIGERLEGAFLVTTVVATLLAVYTIKNGEAGFQTGLLNAAVLILLLTILYKVQVGFFDRGQRFFLNGPIVFGWFMGLAALTAIIRTIDGQYSSLIGMVLVSSFTTAVIWSQSKGPLVALVVAVGLFGIPRLKRRRILLYLFVSAVILSFIFQILPDDMVARYLVFGRFFNATYDLNDFGSVGIRSILWQDAITMFLKNPLFGVGAGNWQFETPLQVEFAYPHNLTLELAAETGMLGLTVYFALLGITFFHSSSWVRTVLVYCLICTSFSGDFEYFRFVVAIPIGLVAAQSFSRSRKPTQSSFYK